MAEVPAHVPFPHPTLGRWIWKGTCRWCGDSFGGYENDHTDPMKDHAEFCDKDPMNSDEYDHDDYFPDGPDSIVTR